jgi:hypothetical protein
MCIWFSFKFIIHNYFFLSIDLYLIFELRRLLKNYTPDDYLLLVGDPAIIGVACSIVSDITNGKYKLIKWDKQERRYYPIEINLYEKGKIDD